ncbi:methylmalonyl-CoA mutase C-terminal domain/subunit [Symbiobacterium terraclitae]|uniref:Methylmalonyl-CoA mutase C-terminal domain/subunit n=1 Tax=Symbiobacterium terraclitae TaxID=557451 RepID=A0ABS4JTM0_9FIRM|nr:methylmalonyl-CoA mutase C-terminal domain/subunit [Symbiobacterium terraclitae]
MEAVSTRKIRVLVAKLGLDAHDRGAKVVARAYRDAGFEVIYTGLYQRPEAVAAAAIQEDVDVVAISSLAGAHGVLIPQLIQLLREQGADDILILAGGIIPEDEVPALLEAGVSRVFGPGSDLDEIIEYTKVNVKR